jgi:predicted DNA-binding transcriptional regulator AlpA
MANGPKAKNEDLETTGSCRNCMSDDPYLRLKQVERMIGVKRTTIMRWVLKGLFPAPVRLPPYTRTSPLVWRRSWVTKWQDEQDLNGYGFIAANDNTADKETANDNASDSTSSEEETAT